jgi:hypothetical protein
LGNRAVGEKMKIHARPAEGKAVISGDGSYLAEALLLAIGPGRGAHEDDCGCCACLAPLIDAADDDAERAS